jgi:hypothetical protein
MTNYKKNKECKYSGVEHDIPLHPVSISIPMTCTHGRHDMLFHLVYGMDNKKVMIDFITAASERLYSLTENAMLLETITVVLENPETVSLQQVRALFFLLLNVDMPLKEYICCTQDKSLLATALNIVDVSTVTEKHAYVMTGAKLPDTRKLESFFGKLRHEVVPNWLQNEGLTLNDFVDTVREEYVIS